MKYIDADKLIAEIERLKSVLKDPLCSQGNILGPDWVAGGNKMLNEISSVITSLQREPRFPQYDNIVEKIFGAGNLEGWEFREAEMLVALAKEELLKSLQQEQPDFDDVDPKHLVHSHYTKVREAKTGRVFWAEYSREAAEWYEAGTGKAYSISDVEIVKEEPEVDLEKSLDEYYKNADFGPSEAIEYTIHKDIARHFYELGRLNARKEE